MYFDNAATTKVSDKIIPDILKMFTENYGNPSSLHSMGVMAETSVNKSRKIISQILNINAEEVIFTSGGTESNNMAITGVSLAYARTGKHLITSKSEHPSVLACFRHLEEQGFNVDYARDAEELVEMVKADTVLISLMHVNNETGRINNIEKVAELVKQKNPETKFHVDAVQSFGKLAVNMKNIDLLSISAHKIHGLKGTGALCIRRGVKIKPLMYGGGQQKNLRPGTEDTVGILSFGLAAELMYNDINKNYQHVAGLKKKLIETVLLGGVHVSDEGNSSPYILNLNFEGIKAEVVVHALAEKGIYVSSGSACSSKNKKKPDVKESIRFSFCPQNTLKEVEECLDALNKIVPVLRRLK